MKNAEEERLHKEKKDLENKMYLNVLQEQGNIDINDMQWMKKWILKSQYLLIKLQGHHN